MIRSIRHRYRWPQGMGIRRWLLEKGADLECKGVSGWTLLWWTAAIGHEAMVKLLLERGAGLESKDRYDRTPLRSAAATGHEAVVKLLLEKGR